MPARSRAPHPSDAAGLLSAVEVFVAGFCEVRGRTHPYLCERRGGVWRLHDAPRKRAADYRKEEWIASGVDPREVDRLARAGAQGRWFVGAFAFDRESEATLRAAYRELGYRLLATEPLCVHPLRRIRRCTADASIERLGTPQRADLLARATRTRPAAEELFRQPDYRQYLALRRGELVGWVRSIETPQGAWCSDLYVVPSQRRQGIGSALLARMLRDDRTRGMPQAVLLSSHTGALLYPQMGYERRGVLLIYAPPKPG
jgi:GNAT superfamily N-acetyltransferase